MKTKFYSQNDVLSGSVYCNLTSSVTSVPLSAYEANIFIISLGNHFEMNNIAVFCLSISILIEKLLKFLYFY